MASLFINYRQVEFRAGNKDVDLYMDESQTWSDPYLGHIAMGNSIKRRMKVNNSVYFLQVKNGEDVKKVILLTVTPVWAEFKNPDIINY